MEQSNMPEEYAFSIKKVAELLQTNEETVRRWIREGKLEAQITSRKQGYSITESSLKKFVNSTPKYATGALIAALSLVPFGTTLPLVAALGALAVAKKPEIRQMEADIPQLPNSIEDQCQIIAQEQKALIDFCKSFEDQLNDLQNTSVEFRNKIEHFSTQVLELQSRVDALMVRDIQSDKF